MDCSLPGSSVHGTLQTILGWVAISSSRGTSQHRIEPMSLHWQVGSLSLSHQGSPRPNTDSPYFSTWRLPSTDTKNHLEIFSKCRIRIQSWWIRISPWWLLNITQFENHCVNLYLTMLQLTKHFHINDLFILIFTEMLLNICEKMSSVQSLNCVQLFVTPRTAACQVSLSITNSQSLLKLMSIDLVMPSNHLILYHPLLLLPSIFPSIRVFSNESVLHIRWPNYWSFSINPSNEYSALISFRMDWLALFAVQGTLKSLLQHHSSNEEILWCSAFFIVQLSHPYMTTGKTIALSRWTFVGQEMSLLFNMLSWLVIAFLPRSKCLLISWLQSPSAVILEPPRIVCHCFHCFPIYLPCDWTSCLVFWMLSFKPAFSLSSFTFIKKLFSSSSLFAISVVSSAYLRLLIFLPANLIPVCASSSSAFLMMYSAYKLNKQGDNI